MTASLSIAFIALCWFVAITSEAFSPSITHVRGTDPTCAAPTTTRIWLASTLDKSFSETASPVEGAAVAGSEQNNSKKDRNVNVNNKNRKAAAASERATSSSQPSFQSQLANSGLASAAAVATAAVNAAVSMKTLEAPDVEKSYVTRGNNINNIERSSSSATAAAAVELDTDGLPLSYDKDLIQAYWNKERGALNQRWREFVGKAVPFLTRLVTLFIRDGEIRDEEIPALSRQARVDLQDLGPTFIKAGQMMSVRPDVLPQVTLEELQKLQDSVVPFDTDTAVAQIEQELGGPLGQFFATISQEPVAAASLAQVYKATLKDGTAVAIKVQRPHVLSIVSKDLYVLRRAAEVFQGLVGRFAPQQKTDYVALLNEWAIGFYTELDFLNEANNQERLRQLLLDTGITKVMVPKVYKDLCTRRILVSEWVDGIRLSSATPQQIAQVTPYAQEAFLRQLFDFGFFHADPHGGNLLLLNKPGDTSPDAVLALIDCGLVATIDQQDRDHMISAVIHMANKDYASLVDDFIQLEILPPNTNRAVVVPLMDKALSPYVKGGGAKKYEAELRKMYGMTEDGSTASFQSQVGGFQAMTQDALTVLESIPFSIPPYFAILGRAIVTLEGLALTGNENYGIIMESYPFIARMLLREGRPEIQKALQQVLYSAADDNDQSSPGIKLTRLLALLNNAAGAVATQEGAAFVDLDAIPKDGIRLGDGLKFVLSDNAGSLRSLLEPEVDTIVDVLSRQIFRRAMAEAIVSLTPPRPPVLPFLGDIFPPTPALDEIPFPLLLPPPPSSSSGGGRRRGSSIAVVTLKEFLDTVAPKLTREEEIYAIGLAEGARAFLGEDIGALIKGERVLSVDSINVILKAVRSGLLGRQDLVSSQAAQGTMVFVQRAVDASRQQRKPSRRSLDFDRELMEAIKGLSQDERKRLDNIMEQLVQRAIARVLGRLSTVEGLL